MVRGTLVAAAATAGAGALARRALARRRAGGAAGGAGTTARWHVLTVNRPLDEVAPGGGLPAPLADLGDGVEVRLRAAPGDRGTEIAVRRRPGERSGGGPGVLARIRGDDSARELRRALRESRSLLETGEILHPDAPGTTERTLLNRPLALVTAHGREEGLL